jgi:hypothetical protein
VARPLKTLLDVRSYISSIREYIIIFFVRVCEGVFAIQGNPDPQRKLRGLVSISSG